MSQNTLTLCYVWTTRALWRIFRKYGLIFHVLCLFTREKLRNLCYPILLVSLREPAIPWQKGYYYDPSFISGNICLRTSKSRSREIIRIIFFRQVYYVRINVGCRCRLYFIGQGLSCQFYCCRTAGRSFQQLNFYYDQKRGDYFRKFQLSYFTFEWNSSPSNLFYFRELFWLRTE